LDQSKNILRKLNIDKFILIYQKNLFSHFYWTKNVKLYCWWKARNWKIKTKNSKTSKTQKILIKKLQKFFDTLKDLEEEKNELEQEEIDLIKQETIEQMEEFEKTLSKLTSGDMSLMNELGKMRLAMQLSVSEAFQTPEVISMFAVSFFFF
jgi:hypothetical protein